MRLLAVLLVAAGLGCDRLGCGGDPTAAPPSVVEPGAEPTAGTTSEAAAEPAAEVMEIEGEVSHDVAADPGKWGGARAGTRLAAGDALRTGSDSSAVVRLPGRGVLRVDPDSVVRFNDDGARVEGQQKPGEVSVAADRREGQGAEPSFEIEKGGAQLEVGDKPMPIRTHFGTAVMEAGARVKLQSARKADRGVRYEVVFGSAAFQHYDGRSENVAAGQSIEVGIGMAVLEDEAAATPDAGTIEERAPAIDAVVRGRVQRRDFGSEQWSDVAEGEQRFEGDLELDVAQGSSVDIMRGGERVTLFGKGRYRLGVPGEPLVDAYDGRLSVTARDRDVEISVPGGSIVARAVSGGSKADVRVEDQTAHVEAKQGRIETRPARGGAEAESEEARGGAEEEAREAQGGSDAKSGGGAEQAVAGAARTLKVGEQVTLAAAQPADESMELPGHVRALKTLEVVVPVGERFRVYDPRPPSKVGFRVERCKEGAELRTGDGRRARGEDRIGLSFKRGLHTYSVFCLKNGRPRVKALASGRFRVVKNGGSAPMPTTRPRNDASADGRRYTMMYQNLKPEVTVSWPGAPAAGNYSVHVKSAGGILRKFSAAKPRHTIRTGVLQDGKNTFWFESDKGQRSPVTTLELLFDNAAPAASLKQPPPSGFSSGSEVRLSGVAVTGSKVSVEGMDVPLEADSRFHAVVPLHAGQQALSVRFQHRRHGVRYYVRRRAGSK